ncbi:c-type cytochrome [Rhodobacter calidifons]|uniref:C-type cytochrome n=1 Tax=Rhodobacter calidifons TaxID=2715277 RepID=A0ABX0GCC9_9RHOB|nr:c-type cytochrome [Rhodobacter calidifons]NHB78589.1 c-type cytochrome [Rhodobacter calidifons]
MRRFLLPLVLSLSLPGLPAPAEEAKTFDRIKVQAGQTLFEAECRRCHATDAKDPSYGPLLEGVVGRKAGTFDGYPYSEALKNAGFVWTRGALKAWMEDNDGLVPGTRMRHVGIADPTVQDFILAYLQSISQ